MGIVWSSLDRFETPLTPPTIEFAVHVAKPAYADWEMEIDRIQPSWIFDKFNQIQESKILML
jgi:hypothetical protein